MELDPSPARPVVPPPPAQRKVAGRRGWRARLLGGALVLTLGGGGVAGYLEATGRQGVEPHRQDRFLLRVRLLHRLPQSVAESRVLSREQKLQLGDVRFNGNILDSFQYSRIGAQFARLGPAGQAEFSRILAASQSREAVGYLWKALAAHNSIATIARFANAIRGKSPAWMAANLTVVNENVPFGGAILNGNRQESNQLTQQWNASCASTVEEAVRGIADPVFALYLHQGGPIDIESNFIPSVAKEPNRRLSQDQAKILKEDGGIPTLGTAPGFGTTTPEYVASLNRISAITGIHYFLYRQPVTIARSTFPSAQMTSGLPAVLAIERGLQSGMPVPLIVGSSRKIEHAVLVLRQERGEFLVFDPGYGQTGWIRKSQFLNSELWMFANGQFGGAGGWSTLWGVLAPTPVIQVMAPVTGNP